MTDSENNMKNNEVKPPILERVRELHTIIENISLLLKNLQQDQVKVNVFKNMTFSNFTRKDHAELSKLLEEMQEMLSILTETTQKAYTSSSNLHASAIQNAHIITDEIKHLSHNNKETTQNKRHKQH